MLGSQQSAAAKTLVSFADMQRAVSTGRSKEALAQGRWQECCGSASPSVSCADSNCSSQDFGPQTARIVDLVLKDNVGSWSKIINVPKTAAAVSAIVLFAL